MPAVSRLLALVVSLAAAGCDHPTPYAIQVIPPNDTLPGPPRRLTFNPEGDWWPAWLPDGSAIGYSYHPLERADRDRCLAFMPASGGRIFRQVCAKGLHEKDSLNAVSTHGVSPGGRIALIGESGLSRLNLPEYRNLYLGSLAGGPVKLVLPFPYMAPSGILHLSAAGMSWANESTLVYLAMYYNYRPSIVFIPADTEYTGIELVQLRLRGDSVAALRVIPNTLGASSVAPGPRDTVFFTMGGDSRVFSLATTTGQVATVHDFGALGIARDVQVAGRTMIAIVGGRVRYFFRVEWGIPVQADSGGPVYTVQLPGGTPARILQIASEKVPGTSTYRHLALDPSGRRFVVEVSKIIERDLSPIYVDTIVGKESDLWLFDVPSR